MKTKFVFTVTYKSDYTIKYKARLVACGYSQIKGIDYNETYSPTVGLESVFICLFIAAWANLSTVIFDVKSAFLEGRADCEQFCRLPLCASDGNTPQRVKIVW
jgi:Reverse transcriptase (RNA-dependent DNA polymerase)